MSHYDHRALVLIASLLACATVWTALAVCWLRWALKGPYHREPGSPKGQ
jgi:hypothetical protein